jgi:histone H3/H4
MVWNSEVGSHRFGLMAFLYNFVCDNRIVWGAREVKEIAIRHTRNAPERFSKEALPRLYAYAESSVLDVEEQLARAARKTVTGKDEDVLSWLRSHDFTKKEGERDRAGKRGAALDELPDGPRTTLFAAGHLDDRRTPTSGSPSSGG